MRGAGEYAAIVAGGNAAIAMHELAVHAARDQLSAEQIQEAMERAVYRAVRQVFQDRLHVDLPESMPDPWADH